MDKTAQVCKAVVTMKMPATKAGLRHIDEIMYACEVVRRARKAKFPEAVTRVLERDLAKSLERWRCTRQRYEESVAK